GRAMSGLAPSGEKPKGQGPTTQQPRTQETQEGEESCRFRVVLRRHAVQAGPRRARQEEIASFDPGLGRGRDAVVQVEGGAMIVPPLPVLRPGAVERGGG